ncbi:SNF2 domain-containing protein ENL1 [Lathyrus oleraceus]|uniref:SNF2 domain-containing protein ENL1 n=1 Tax=Pisum sativum TaxID=3888 RepID=UPI0021CE5AD9|nr:SNF2 domain-containing protein ENL1-like [Pisum sativum]
MSSNEDDLDLLLSLQDKVPETPPASPSPLDFDGDDDVVPRRERPDMSVFKDAVQDCLLDQPPNPNPNPNPKPKPYNKSLGDDPQLDKFSGLRIRDQCLTPAELRESVQDIRFVRLPVIK